MVYEKDFALPGGHGNFACEVQYLITIVYGRFILGLLYRKLSSSIDMKYCISQVKLPCPFRRRVTFNVHRFSSVPNVMEFYKKKISVLDL